MIIETIYFSLNNLGARIEYSVSNLQLFEAARFVDEEIKSCDPLDCDYPKGIPHWESLVFRKGDAKCLLVHRFSGLEARGSERESYSFRC